MHPCGHSSIKFLWSCDTRAQDSFSLFKLTQCFQNMLLYQFMHSSESILGVRKIFTAFTLQVYSHFFQKLIMIIENLQRKAGNYLFSKACRFFFLARQLIIVTFSFFFSSFLFFLSLSLSLFKVIIICLFPLSPSFFLFFSEKVVRTRAHTTYLRLTTR